MPRPTRQIPLLMLLCTALALIATQTFTPSTHANNAQDDRILLAQHDDGGDREHRDGDDRHGDDHDKDRRHDDDRHDDDRHDGDRHDDHKDRDHKDHARKDDDHRFGDHGDRRRRLSDEQVEAAIDLLKELRPDFAERLAEARKENPERVALMIHHRFPHLRHLLALREDDPAMYELRVEDVRLSYRSRSLAHQFKQAQQEDNEDRAEELRDQLDELVEEHFEVRQQIRELELERLEQRIEDLREQIDARSDDRDELIEKRVLNLVGTEEGGEW